eukprot:1315153-Amphidinium_carterae.1
MLAGSHDLRELAADGEALTGGVDAPLQAPCSSDEPSEENVVLKIATWNCLSLDRESADAEGNGLAVPAGLSWLGNSCKTRGIDVLGVQESRMRGVSDRFQLNSGYTVLAIPASRTRGGVLLLLKESKHLKFLAMSVISERVLLVLGKIRGLPISFIVGHAPVRDAPAGDHADFCGAFQRALQGVCANSSVVVLADLNLRVAGLMHEFPVVGPNALSVCKLHAEHGRPLLDVCVRKGLFFANTFYGQPTDYTWTHPRGHLVQIDYILLTDSLLKQLVRIDIVAASDLASIVKSDHNMVTAVIHFKKSQKVEGTLQSGKAVKNAEQRKQLVDSLAGLVAAHQHWLGDHDVQPEEKLEFLDREIGDIVNDLPKARHFPKKPWISPESWTELQRLNQLRRAIGLLRTRQDLASVQCAVSLFNNPGEFWETASRESVEVACTNLVKSRAKAVKKMLLGDKRAWFYVACSSLDNPLFDKAELHMEFKRLCKRDRRRQVKLIAGPDGNPSVTIQDSNQAWAEHWLQHLCARRFDAPVDAQRLIVDHSNDATTEQVQEITMQEVMLSYNKLSSRKAAIDALHPTVYVAAKHVIAPVLKDLYNKCLSCGG